MALDINNTTISQASGMLTINTGAVTQISSAGAVMRSNSALFSAYGTAAWVYPTASAWNKLVNFTNVQFNGNSVYNGSLSRFTAPVDGRYAFQLVLYLLRDSATPGEYIHPSFAVNGAVGGRTPNGLPNYRIRFHGYALATYEPGQIAQSYDLLAGDYVEPYAYVTTGGVRYYPGNSRFSGFMLG